MQRILIIVLISICQTGFGQQAIGFNLDPYSGVDRIFYNPARSQEADSRWEITLASAHAFLYTDYAFIRRTNLLRTFGLQSLPTKYNQRNVVERPPQPFLFYDLDRGSKMATAQINVTGPSIRYSIDQHHAVGLFFRSRAQLSSLDIPEGLGIYELTGLQSQDILSINASSLVGLSWHEMGLHFSKSTQDFSIGVNAKYIVPSEGIIVRNHGNYSLATTDDVVMIEGGNVNFSATSNLIDMDDYSLFDTSVGYGVGIDVGVGYQYSPTVRFSASLMDVGRVWINENVENYFLDNQPATALVLDEYMDNDTPREFLDMLNRDLDITTSSQALQIGLASKLRLEADLEISNKLFISAQLSQRLPLLNGTIKRSKNTLRSENSVFIIPRYQSKYLSFAMPIGLYEYTKPRIGAVVRLGYITIGSDQLNSLFFDHDFRGSDIYAKVSFFPFWNPKKKDKGIRCFDFVNR